MTELQSIANLSYRIYLTLYEQGTRRGYIEFVQSFENGEVNSNNIIASEGLDGKNRAGWCFDKNYILSTGPPKTLTITLAKGPIAKADEDNPAK